MELNDITPLILTWNEAPNIGRCLDHLQWAHQALVVDSFSTDETLGIISRYPSVRVVQRPFDTFAGQCNFGVNETGIQTEWVLSLDADYEVSDAFVQQLENLTASSEIVAYQTPFVYRVWGHPLRSGVYPPRAVLFRRRACDYVDDGHAHRLHIREGRVETLAGPIFHDDRKSLSRWLSSQASYMEIEAGKLRSTPVGQLSFADRLRRTMVLGPPVILLYCLLLRGGILDGWPGWYYALQRMTAEAILSLKLLELKLAPISK